ncbi:hypothetical protein GCM10009527_055530 [Actinomadura nitritigenes]
MASPELAVDVAAGALARSGHFRYGTSVALLQSRVPFWGMAACWKHGRLRRPQPCDLDSGAGVYALITSRNTPLMRRRGRSRPRSAPKTRRAEARRVDAADRVTARRQHRLGAHPDVRRISLTGSVPTARAIAAPPR